MREQEGRADIDERAGETKGELFGCTVVVFVPSVQHALVSKPGEDV